MKTLAIAAFVCAGLLACERESDRAPAAAATAPAAVAAAQVQLPGAIYKEALEAARASITADNAAERLTALERQIDLERQQLD